MSIARDIFCFAVPFTMVFAAVLSVATGVGCFGGPFMLGPFSWMSLSGSFKIFFLMLLAWLMP